MKTRITNKSKNRLNIRLVFRLKTKTVKNAAYSDLSAFALAFLSAWNTVPSTSLLPKLLQEFSQASFLTFIYGTYHLLTLCTFFFFLFLVCLPHESVTCMRIRI